MHIKVSKKKKQIIHSTQNWNKLIVLEGEYTIFKLISDENRKVIGQVGIELGDDFAYIFSLAIGPEYRNLKLGSYLLDKIEQYAKIHEHDIVYLQVEKSNEDFLLPFYMKRGYKKNYKDDLSDE